MIFDSHAHYDDESFQEDRERLLASMDEAGVGRIVNISADRASWDDVLALNKQYPFVYGTIGLHPSCLKDDAFAILTPQDVAKLDEMESYLKVDKIVAIGEIGLDYHWDKDNHDVQKLVFVKQLQMARAHGLAVVVHSREAAADTYEILKEYGQDLRLVMHCYSYSVEQAQAYIKMGYYLGIGGVVTYKNGKKLKEVVEAIPLEHMVLETDCPYLSPEPFRGKRNDSRNLSYVVAEIARLKGISVEEVERVTWTNANSLYSL